MREDKIYRGKLIMVDSLKSKKPLKENCCYECVIGFNQFTRFENIIRAIKAVAEILKIEPISVYIHKD